VHLGGEVVVADPFQRYRGLEIAADAPGTAARAQVPYHLVGDLGLQDASSAGDFAARAHAAIDDILGRGRVPIVAGGTGLYLRAALADMGMPDPVPARLRTWAEGLVAHDPAAALRALRERDAVAAGRVDAANPRRLARALEVATAGGAAREDTLWSATTRHPGLLVAVTRPRPVLDRLIAARVRRELDDGLVAELEAALELGMSREAAQVIGAREVAAVRAGELGAAELEERLAARTRRLARRQLAWLRRTPVALTLDLGEDPAEAALPRLLSAWAAAGGAGGMR
jgi:tRNA dimethylallyltransferase